MNQLARVFDRDVGQSSRGNFEERQIPVGQRLNRQRRRQAAYCMELVDQSLEFFVRCAAVAQQAQRGLLLGISVFTRLAGASRRRTK